MQLPNIVALNAVGYRRAQRAQKSANASATRERKSAHKSAKEYETVKQPGLGMPSVGIIASKNASVINVAHGILKTIRGKELLALPAMGLENELCIALTQGYQEFNFRINWIVFVGRGVETECSYLAGKVCGSPQVPLS